MYKHSILILMGRFFCADGSVSFSIGSKGACSHHGGVSTFSGFSAFSVFL